MSLYKTWLSYEEANEGKEVLPIYRNMLKIVLGNYLLMVSRGASSRILVIAALIVIVMISSYFLLLSRREREAPTPEVPILVLRSSAFESGGNIPQKYTCDGQDISPPLSWSDPPRETVSFVLIVEDIDAPKGIFTHWIIFNIPASLRSLPEGVPKQGEVEGIGTQGKNDFNEIGYGGPCPPPGSTHRYVFKLYALDISLDLNPGATKEQVIKGMEGHILAYGELIGRYGRG